MNPASEPGAPPRASTPDAPRRASFAGSQPNGFRLGALGLGLLAAALLCEAGVRASGAAPAIPGEYAHFVADSVLPWKPEPESVHSGTAASGEFRFHYAHNSLGFRDDEHAFAKPAGTFRIVGIGDSFTYGVGADYAQTFLARLEHSLVRDRELPVEVIKLGVPRYWPEPERLVLEHYGMRYDPDLVVVAFLANDFNDTQAGLAKLQVSEGFLVTRSAERLGPLARALHTHSHAARIVLSRITAALEPAPQTRPPEAVWEEIYRHYARIVELAASAGAPVVFLHVPQRPPWAAWAPDPPRRVAGFCATHGCRVVDALPDAMAHADPASLYYAKDGHCTPDGYALLARVLEESLLANELRPLRTRQLAQRSGDPGEAAP